MLNPNFIEDMVKRLSDAIPPTFQAIKNDMERNFRAVLQSTFAKLDLVTREEFDAQVGILTKTRAKLEALERQLTILEAEVAHNTGQTKKKRSK